MAELIKDIIKAGDGTAIHKGQTAVVHYDGTLEDGTLFDSSRQRGQTFAFKLGAGMVIKGWDEGVEGMHIGEIRKLTIPSEMGYGTNGVPGVIPPNATLVFEVELVAIR